MVTRDQRQVAAVVLLLQAMPPELLTAVLDGLGISQEQRPEKWQDNRRCGTCGFGWVRHKVYADDPSDGHEWNPVGRPPQ